MVLDILMISAVFILAGLILFMVTAIVSAKLGLMGIFLSIIMIILSALYLIKKV